MGGSNFIDLTGQKFGRLTVIERAENRYDNQGKVRVYWKCKCDCGNECEVFRGNLKRGTTQSCGCLLKESVSERFKNYNTYDLSGEYGIGYTNNTNSEFYFDLEDYEKIKDYCWTEHIVMNNYHRLETTQNGIHMTMHYVIMGDKYYDHIDRNPLNNRKENLRKASCEQNGKNRSKQYNNTSGVSGVNYNICSKKWVSRIYINKKETFLGGFVNFNDAVVARLKAEKEYYGEFVPQQHLYEEYGIN